MLPYDYIIIGAGSAGCVLANRLSAERETRILLLEAGDKDTASKIHIPAAFPELLKTAVDWDYNTIPQAQLMDRELYLPRGRVLGGSSSINAMIYIRGNQADYNHWAALGNKGWAFNDVLPYFKKAEHQTIFHDEYHGTDGPLYVSNRVYSNPLSEVFLQAARAIGYTLNPDFNGASQEGFGFYQVTQQNGVRCSAAKAYLSPAVQQRSNLTIATKALAQRILFTGQKATGVVFQQNGQSKQALATKAVLLCAGAYNSPQLLQLSGIGPGARLQQMGIPVVKDLPGVGQNLQDHLVTFTIFNSNYRKSLDAAVRIPAVFGHLLNYTLRKQGPFTSNIGEAGGFVRSSADEPVPDIQFHFGPCYFIDHGFNNPKRGFGYSIGAKVLVPQSRGSVFLSSSQAEQPPIIDHNYLSAYDDLRKSISAWKLCAALGTSSPFASYFKSWHTPTSHLQEDTAIADLIRATAETLYHPVGTCKMGQDPLAVVDDQLRVHGIEGLRVIDASIMPTIVRGNTNAPTIMIAEKGADLLLHKDAG